MSAQNGHSSYKIILDGETVAQVGDDLSPVNGSLNLTPFGVNSAI